jgi:SsrA-binding protein
MQIIAVNKKANFDYKIIEKFKAGVALSGHETRSAKLRGFNLTGAYAIIKNGEVFLVGAEISSFQPKNAPSSYDPSRTKKLLLRRAEIKYLRGKLEGGLVLVPLKAFVENNFIKIELGLGRGLKKYDKRELIKKKEAKREIRRSIK